jgi:hypothetical protein
MQQTLAALAPVTTGIVILSAAKDLLLLFIFALVLAFLSVIPIRGICFF